MIDVPINSVGVRIVLSDRATSMPFGKEYTAKGFYFNGKYIVTVGAIAADGSNTIRLKYLRAEIKSITVL